MRIRCGAQVKSKFYATREPLTKYPCRALAWRDGLQGARRREWCSLHEERNAADRPPSQRPEGFDDIGPSAALRRTVEIWNINAPSAPCRWANLVKTRSRILDQRLPGSLARISLFEDTVSAACRAEKKRRRLFAPGVSKIDRQPDRKETNYFIATISSRRAVILPSCIASSS
jgi:hypothetical protein